MKLKRYLFLYIGLLAIFFTNTSFYRVSDNEKLINSIFQAIDKIKTLRYELKCSERIKMKLIPTQSKVKLQVSPRKLYLNVNGPEVLWIEGENNGTAYVNPGAFPYVNLNLDPNGAIMRKDQHHTIHEVGYQYLADIVKFGMKKVGDKLNNYFSVADNETFDGRPCYKITIIYPEFEWQDYTVKKGETLITIARKYRLSEYMILEKNSKLKWYDDVKEGQKIKIPNAYSKLTILLVDKEYLLPVSNKVYDDLGLFESYEYYNLKVNTAITPEEFTKNYKDYRF